MDDLRQGCIGGIATTRAYGAVTASRPTAPDVTLEALEPRLLMNADLVTSTLATIRSADSFSRGASVQPREAGSEDAYFSADIVGAAETDTTNPYDENAPVAGTNGGFKNIWLLGMGGEQSQSSIFYSDVVGFANGLAAANSQYTSIHTRTFKEAGRQAFDDNMSWLSDNAGPGDLAIFYYSGHGTNEFFDGGITDEPDGMDELIFATDVRDDEVTEQLQKISLEATILFIVDSCKSGGMLDGSQDPSSLSNIYGMTASGAHEESWGEFALALRSAFNYSGGKMRADLDGDLNVTFDELFAYGASKTGRATPVNFDAGGFGSKVIAGPGVTATYTPPTARDDSITVGRNQGASVNVLINDTDPFGYALNIVNISEPEHGKVINNGDSFTYLPSASWIGEDTFTYTIQNVAGFTDTATVTVDVVPWRVVELAEGGRAQFLDSAGNLVTIGLKGGGTARLFFAESDLADLHYLELDGTNAKSSLTIKTGRKGSRTSVGDIIVHGSIGRITAKTTDLIGDITVEGSLGKIYLGDVTGGHSISIGGTIESSQAVSISFDRVWDFSIKSQIPIKSLTVTEWLDKDGRSDSVIAPWIAKLTTKGDRKNHTVAGNFAADLSLSGIGAIKTALGRTKIAGSLIDSTWNIDGNLGTLTVNGTVRNSTVRVSGDMRSIRAAAIYSSDFLAGCASDTARMANVSSDFTSVSKIGSIQVKGIRGSTDRFFVDSNFSAATIGKVKLLNVKLNNGGDQFGIFALDQGTGGEIKSVSYKDTAPTEDSGLPLSAGNLSSRSDMVIRII